MARWILKSEPSVYSFQDLERDGRTVWDGITNAQALINLRAMQPGDQAMIYHSGDGKELVGLARITSAAYPDPKGDNPKHVVVDIEPVRPLARPVSLAAIKAEPAFADLGLVRQGRLSVVPVNAEQWRRLLKMAGTPARP
ncbi:MAG TPA: EVE domain-containing protein [Gemmatimonadales bacterium]|nr:EVE domain-containing protein [Gemmatimonadales bacterium]